MAGRPAGGSGTGILVGMIIAVAVALISLVLLVVLWNNHEELKSARDDANRIANRLMRSNEMQSGMKAWLDQAGDGGRDPSVSRLMTDELTRLGEIISADGATAEPGLAEKITTRVAAFWDQVRADRQAGRIEDPGSLIGSPLLDAVTTMYGMYTQHCESLAQARTNMDQLNAEIKALTQAQTDLQEQFNKTADELRSQLATVEDERSEFRATKVDEFQEIEGRLQAREDALAAEKEDLRQRISSLSTELEKTEARTRDLQGKVKEFQILPQARMAARRADGKVVLARAGEGTVFVDRGKSDHLVLGLRFAVYPPETGIPSTGVAKAQIEVARIGPEVTECRVVWDNPLFPIIDGDLIANPIYDRQRSQVFYVAGGFDLNHDNQDDPEGRGQVQALITDFGGQIADGVNPRVDFVVVGARPYVRRLSSNPSKEAVELHDEQQRNAEAFDAVLTQALQLSIPIFTQETFLNFLGRQH